MSTNVYGRREDQWAVTLVVQGQDFGVWDRKGGGGKDSEESTYNPGGMAERIALGGRPSFENITVSKLFDPAAYKALLPHVGRGEATVVMVPLDRNRQAYGDPIRAWGVLKRVSPPDHNSESSDAALMEVEIVPEGIS